MQQQIPFIKVELYNKRGVAVIMSFSPPTKADTMDKFTKHILILIFFRYDVKYYINQFDSDTSYHFHLTLNGMLVDGMLVDGMLIDHTYKSNRFRRFISPMLAM